MNSKLNLAVIFGSKSPEHEVSVITGLQILENADKEKYNLIPIYIDKTGKWFSGQALLDINNFKNVATLHKKITEQYINPGSNSQLIPISALSFAKKRIKIDVAFPAIHGSFGEDGTLQGLLEMANIPYVGAGVTSSGIGMDKILQKDALKSNGIPVVNYVWFTRNEWIDDRNLVIKKVENSLKYPVFIKPANLGSSIGINKAKNRDDLTSAIELAVTFDRRIIVEQGLEDIIEINCSVLGFDTVVASVCEQPVSTGEVLSYEDKYMRGSKNSTQKKGMASLSRIIPAPISEKLTKEIQETAKKVFKTLDAAGVARIDFLLNPKTGKFFVCEINTLPGSISFYLWEKSGYPFPKLIDKLVELALERFSDRKKNNYSFNSNLLENFGSGSKGTKS